MAGNPSVDQLPIGVLALQGDFREHLHVLQQLGETAVAVKSPEQLEHIAALIIPGGESSVIDKLSRLYGLFEPIRAAIHAGLPVYGTCAGLIMLADTVEDSIEGQQSFGGLDVVVRRNAFGSQTDSFETDLSIPELGENPVHAVFIRAPVVESVGARARALATLDDGRIVAVEQGNLLGTSFHPEITGDTRFHEYFVRRVRATQ
ncbi:pyridoxal phosphate synthase yaaE subunit [Salinibacterium amurskyense]|uniref:Pyridoxal 5'-phosphate synthase subunit PdxT n=1 Tax=Salinibacterium amurskyense TaxID=205941 RepID=A0A2M9D985_9MICO|nr:pyridoxal 5'-phosphate synthase glutaminase subunit PdxT [Salinibacterium amurskyense]PJJ82296.1 pyridoxal phosphate synthase yaaE subunit [Salinibacterium amurskyense]RLQ82057.1 pyridoxal 5'-phosphate synthase glutaminase subunit PdxT [Salinibacterium amurskyense]GHD77454.1 pyridoxal 5'-phosphate synthase subunit PdxT [Salinibacterium amurskyense]